MDTSRRFLDAFAEDLRVRKQDVGREWMNLVRKSPDVPQAARVSIAALQDHVPTLLDDLVERLHEHTARAAEDVAEHSRTHGREQWKCGYNISELIWEIYIIRRVITESALADFERRHPGYSGAERTAAETLVHDFFHRLTCNSVDQFAREQQAKLEKINQELSETSESRKRLIRTVAHELRNILNTLALSVDLLADEENPVQRREMTAASRRILNDMSRILNELLDYSVLIAGRAHLEIQRFSASSLFKEIVSQWAPTAEAEGLKFESKCDPALGEIISDRLKLKQIAGNLLSNAVKYRKRGQGGYVGISFISKPPDHWKLIVADTGIGIAQEDLDSLFGDFQRIRPTDKTGGTGLGLAICREFTEMLGGRINVASRAGEGTRFEVTVPTRMHADGEASRLPVEIP